MSGKKGEKVSGRDTKRGGITDPRRKKPIYTESEVWDPPVGHLVLAEGPRPFKDTGA